MYFLQWDFVISGLIIIALLIPLYIYRKEIYSKFVREGSIKHFLRDIDAYLSLHHPKFKYNLDIVKKLDNEKDVRRKKILIVEYIIRQFAEYEYELKTQRPVSKEMLWGGYDQNSVLLKDNKLPIDWNQRKKAAWTRDKCRCNRCGKKTTIDNSQALLAKQMKNGGGFNLENIVILCNDCSRIIKSSNIEKTSKDLHILENLLRRV